MSVGVGVLKPSVGGGVSGGVGVLTLVLLLNTSAFCCAFVLNNCPVEWFARKRRGLMLRIGDLLVRPLRQLLLFLRSLYPSWQMLR